MPNDEFQVKQADSWLLTRLFIAVLVFWKVGSAERPRAACVENSVRGLHRTVSFLARRTIFYHFSEFRIAHQRSAAQW